MANIGEILMNFDAKKTREKQVISMKKDVKFMKRKRDVLNEREQRIRQDLNSGSVQPATNYKLPLNVIDNTNQNIKIRREDDVNKLKTIYNIKRDLQGLAFTQGITVWKDNKDEIKFLFDPYVGGKSYGPYELRVKFVLCGKSVLRGHTLPHAVGTRQLFHEYHDHETDSNTSLSVRFSPFLNNISRRLRTFLSRQQQCEELREKFEEELRGFKTSNHFTAVSFSIILRVENEDTESDEDELVVTISMIYNKDGERPKPDSVKAVFSKDMPQEDVEAAMSQCRAFYTKRLTEALLEAF